MFIKMAIIAGCMHVGRVVSKKNSKSRKKIVKQSLTIDKEKELNEANELLTGALVSVSFASTGAMFSLPILTFTSGVCTLYSTIPLLKRAKKAVFEERKVRIEILDSVAVVASLASRYFFVSSLALLAFSAAQRLRLVTQNRTMKSLESVFGEKPEFVWVLKDRVETQMPFESIKVGDIIIVNAGALIPIDGIITYGIASIDQHMLTGEFQPAEKGIGENVLSSTLVISGRLEIRVERTGAETVASKVSEILKNTASFTDQIESQGQAIADKSVIPTFVLSTLAFPVAGPPGTIALLSSDFLDNMRIIAPISMLNFLHNASENGILIKDGRSLQQLPEIDTIVFDKTGTLTMDQPHVGKIYTFEGMQENKVLALSAAAEFRQKHPAAIAILKKAKEVGVSIPKIDEASYRIGYGISVKVDGKILLVGSERFMKIQDVSIPEGFEKITKKCQEQGLSLIYTALCNRVIGIIELKPTIRPEVPDILKKLKNRNISFYIISGDHEKPTQFMAKKLGIKNWFAQVLPEDKAELIGRLQKEGKKVCFVGDGINDSIALKKANVSVSMSGASSVATDSAQIVLMDQSLEKLPYLFDIAYNFKENIKNILTTISVPAVMGVGGVFLVHISLGAVFMLYVVSLCAGAITASLPHLKSKNRSQNRMIFGSRLYTRFTDHAKKNSICAIGFRKPVADRLSTSVNSLRSNSSTVSCSESIAQVEKICRTNLEKV